jgi:undecaprenyl diphosphate synthase
VSTSPASIAETPGGDAAGPRHVAIIMDGNGRWAAARRLPRIAGHRQGIEAVRKVVRAAPKLGIETLTLYAFSSENWRRPAGEVEDLMGLLRHYLVSEIEELASQGARLTIIGDYRRLKPALVKLIDDAVARTASNRRIHIVIALNYGARDEMLRAARQLVADAAAGTLDPQAIDEAAIEARLDTAGLPPLDLLIRTSGECRLSNFLLWQAAYAELLFVDTLWPDFDDKALADALAEFAARDRRYGGR